MPFRGSVGALPLFLFWYYHYITLLWKSQGEFVNNSSGFSGALTALYRGVSRVTGCACVWFVALVAAIEPPFFIVFAIDRARSIYRSGIVNRLRCFYKYRADGLTPAAARGSARRTRTPSSTGGGCRRARSAAGAARRRLLRARSRGLCTTVLFTDFTCRWC